MHHERLVSRGCRRHASVLAATTAEAAGSWHHASVLAAAGEAGGAGFATSHPSSICDSAKSGVEDLPRRLRAVLRHGLIRSLVRVDKTCPQLRVSSIRPCFSDTGQVSTLHCAEHISTSHSQGWENPPYPVTSLLPLTEFYECLLPVLGPSFQYLLEAVFWCRLHHSSHPAAHRRDLRSTQSMEAPRLGMSTVLRLPKRVTDPL